MSKYVGLPARDDIAGLLRHHAQRIADGDIAKPSRLLVITFTEQGESHMTAFPAYDTRCEAIAELLDAVQGLNARESH